jgi:ATP-dependent DNA helicase RecG
MLFKDRFLMLMEREGSGYDKIYATLLGNGKQIPEIIEKDDSVTVVIRKKILKSETVSFLSKINDEYNLNEKEIICLGLIAQHTILSQKELTKILGLADSEATKTWTNKLLDYELIICHGKTKIVQYYINPKILQKAKFKGKTTLKKIEPYRLKELILADLTTYPKSSISEIHERIGKEINIRRTKHIIDKMRMAKELSSTGYGRWTRYSINQNR